MQQQQYNGPTVILQAPPKTIYPISQKAVYGISATILTLGIILIILQFVGIGLKIGLYEAGAGVWSGLWFILTGSFGISASQQKTKCKIVTFMVLSILSASTICVSLLYITAAGLSYDISDEDWYCNYYDPTYDPFYRPCSHIRAGIGLNATMVTLAIIIGILSIIGSAFSCGAFCCGRPPQATTVPHVVPAFSPQGPQPQYVVLVPPQNYAPGHYNLGYDHGAAGNQNVPVRQGTPPPAYHNLAQGTYTATNAPPPQPRAVDYPAVHQATGYAAPQNETKANQAYA